MGVQPSGRARPALKCGCDSPLAKVISLHVEALGFCAAGRAAADAVRHAASERCGPFSINVDWPLPGPRLQAGFERDTGSLHYGVFSGTSRGRCRADPLARNGANLVRAWTRVRALRH